MGIFALTVGHTIVSLEGLVCTLAAHLHTEQVVTSLETFMIISSDLRTFGDSNKTPPIQFPGERCVFRFFKVLREDFRSKLLFLVDYKSFAMRKPCDNVFVVFII